jgi:hypothetical protein
MEIEKLKNCTDDHVQGSFKPHGRVEMFLRERIICVKARGPFNQELMTALMALEAEFLREVAAQGPFGEIVSFYESVLASPEVMLAHRQLLEMLKGAGLAHKATAYVITPNLEGAEFTAPIAANNYAAVAWPFQIFDNLSEAQVWVERMLAE